MLLIEHELLVHQVKDLNSSLKLIYSVMSKIKEKVIFLIHMICLVTVVQLDLL